MDPEKEIIIQRDSEGNGFSPLDGADDQCIYSELGMEVYDINWSANQVHMEEEVWKQFKKNNIPCIVLYPLF
jgi:hypothetical protein